ncbi:MFS transporter [Paenalkalicoccus suaedae]|uniref:MFS transporter n=1 Tax=Paenalkalicoccus suaedae TaxID=2592382 RepID=A0A859FHG7_9BACI|nr:MFS transporter [Paenalkalicoccus suaedae]QKS72124.1 MFS transporter [Paenalkalicoccus suaedae]
MPRAIWILIIGMSINITGASFLWPLNTIYMSEELGRSLTAAGVVLMINAAAGIIGNLIGGKLFDFIGGFKTMVMGTGIAMMSAFTLAVNYESFPAYVICLVLIGFGGGMVIPCMYAMAGAVWPEGGRRPFNAMYVSQNVGVALGAALGGLLASFRFDFVFLGNGLMYAVFLILALVFFRNLESGTLKGRATNVFEQAEKIEHKRRFHALAILCIGFLICWIAYTQWASTIAAFTQEVGIPLSSYSLLWTINGLMIILCQPLIRFFVERYVHSLKAQIYVGLVIFMAAYAVLSQTEVFTGFVVAMIILTIGEMFVWPAIPTIAHQLAPEGKAGFYQGIVNSIATGGRLIGPLFGGFMADTFGMQILFYVILFLFIIPFITTKLFDRGVPHIDFQREEKEAS